MTNFIMRPTPTRKKKKINLYKLIVARSDITAALTACGLFIEKVDRLGHDLYYPLYCSIIICYGRPFSDNKPLGPLPSQWRKFSSPRLQATHNELIDARNSLIAHSDLKVRKVNIVPEGAKIGETNLQHHGIGLTIESYYFPLLRYRDIHDTCFDLGNRLNQAVEDEIEKLYGQMYLPKRAFPLRFDDGL